MQAVCGLLLRNRVTYLRVEQMIATVPHCDDTLSSTIVGLV